LPRPILLSRHAFQGLILTHHECLQNRLLMKEGLKKGTIAGHSGLSPTSAMP
jgi:hypothetical protein